MRIRCPHCSNPVEVLDGSSFKDVECLSCGSTFNFLGDDTLTYRPSTPRSLAHFHLISEVGRGHFGTVWMAHDEELDRTVAVKIPRREQVEDDGAELFLREAQAAAGLRHPNIVTVYEVGRSEGTLYIVTEFVRGVTLADRLSSGKPLSLTEAAELCIKIADALHHAHEQGVIHRDLKPSNIILDVDGEPHVTDFGLAKREAAEITMTADGDILGTPAYMSPEQAMGQARTADRRCDVYAMGVILFELITGNRPFRGNMRMLVQQVIHDDPPSPSKLNNHISRDLETICLKCLEKDAGNRYATAEAFADELQRYLNGEAILARPIGPLTRGWRWCKRKPAVAGLSAGLAIALLLGLAGTSWQWLRAEQTADDEAEARLLAEDEAERARQAKIAEAEARKQTRRLLYVTQMNLIQKAWETGDVARIQALIDSFEVPPGETDFRAFEWDYWSRVAERFTLILPHGSTVFRVAMSSDGSTLASAGLDRLVKVWDRASGKLKATLPGHKRGVRGLAFSPDGTRLASASDDGTVRIWDVATRKVVHVLRAHQDRVWAVAFAPDGETLASASHDRTIRLWDANTGAPTKTLSGHADYVVALAFSPDGAQLASGGFDAKVKLWNVADGEPIRDLNVDRHGAWSVAYSADGKTVAAGMFSGAINVWEASTGELKTTLIGHDGIVGSLAFFPDGKILASASVDGTTKFWETSGTQSIEVIHTHTRMYGSLAMSADGNTLVSASGDGTVKVWNAARDGPTSRLPAGADRAIAFVPQAGVLATAGSDHTVKLWAMDSGQMIAPLEDHSDAVFALAASPDGTLLASAGNDREIRIWDLSSNKLLTRLKGHRSGVFAVAFSPEGTELVSGGVDRTVRIWNVATGELKQNLKLHTAGVRGVACSPDGNLTASASLDGTAQLWDRNTKSVKAVLKGHAGGLRCVAFSSDGNLVATGGIDRTIKVWNAEDGTLIKTLEGHTGVVTSLVFSPDESTLFSGSMDRQLKMWDVVTGKAKTTVAGHRRQIVSVAFWPQGSVLASSSADGVVRLWRGKSK